LRGYHSFDGDQAYRLPLLLHQQDPRVYAGDPFVQAFEAFNPHRGSLMVLDVVTRPLGLSAGLFTIFVLTFGATCLGVDRLTRVVWPNAGSNVGLVAVGLVLVAKAGNIGTNHLFEAMVLDRLTAFAMGWLALASVVADPARGRTPALAAIALATLVHPSVGLQLAIVLGASWTVWSLLGRWMEVGIRTAILGVVGLAVAVVPGLAVNLAPGSSLLGDMPIHDFWLLTAKLQSPQHMLPHLWRMPQWLAWACYLALTALAIAGARKRPEPFPIGHRSPARLRLTAVLAIILLWLGAAWYAIEVRHQVRVTVFQPFRMATVARGIALVLVAGRLVVLWRSGGWLGRLRATLIPVAFGGDWLLVVVTLAELTVSAVEVIRSRVVEICWAVEKVVFRYLRAHHDSVARIFPPFARGGQGGWSRHDQPPGLPMLSPSQSFCIPLTRREESVSISKAPAPPPLTPPSQGGERDRSLAPSFDCAPQKHASRNRPSSTVNTNFSPVPPDPPSERGGKLIAPHQKNWSVIDATAWFGMLALGFNFLARHDTEFGNRTLLAALSVGLIVGYLGRRQDPVSWLDSLTQAWTPRRLRVAFGLTWVVPLAALLAAATPLDHPASRHPLVRSLINRCRFAAVPADDVERLALWCRDHTPASARFIGPPGPKTFRLWSLRSLAFNRAASPYNAAGLADWFSRFQEHVNFHGSPTDFVHAYLADRHGFESRYQAQTDTERAALAIRQGATYIVAAAPNAGDRSTDPGPLELLHVEGHYAVYQVKLARLPITDVGLMIGDN